jgi:Fe-S-cluster formation regulator IscX/YfhJ
MVLKAKNTDAANANAKPTFEGMDEGTATATAVAEKPTVAVTEMAEQPAAEATTAAAATAAEAAPAAAPEAAAAEAAKTTAVAISNAKAGAVTVSKKFVGALSDLENVFDPSTLDFNTFPRVVVGLDGFSKDDLDLGKKIKLEVMSYNTRYVASPGDDSDEAKKLVRYSLDGKTISSSGDDNGMDIFAYIQEMKTVHGMADAGLKEYLSIFGFLVAADDAEGKFNEIDEADREIVELQVPPQSRALFTRYQMTEGVKIQRGVTEATPYVVCTQEKKQGSGTKKFALIHFSNK